MPTEQEMLPKDKYTVFDRKVKRYRKGIHSELLPYVEYGGVVVLGVWRPNDSRWWMKWKRSQGREQALTNGRGTKVDKSQPTTESSRFLSGERRFCVHYMLLYGQHGIWRISGIKTSQIRHLPVKATTSFLISLIRACTVQLLLGVAVWVDASLLHGWRMIAFSAFA